MEETKPVANFVDSDASEVEINRSSSRQSAGSTGTSIGNEPFAIFGNVGRGIILANKVEIIRHKVDV